MTAARHVEDGRRFRARLALHKTTGGRTIGKPAPFSLNQKGPDVDFDLEYDGRFIDSSNFLSERTEKGHSTI